MCKKSAKSVLSRKDGCADGINKHLLPIVLQKSLCSKTLAFFVLSSIRLGLGKNQTKVVVDHERILTNKNPVYRKENSDFRSTQSKGTMFI